jgi:hypothetical protein
VLVIDHLNNIVLSYMVSYDWDISVVPERHQRYLSFPALVLIRVAPYRYSRQTRTQLESRGGI